jgi:demethoxyubiquinone hydroxylase (CLK1/Coq7/Cat5 family)
MEIVCETPKVTSAKWTEGVTQAVERLLCKHRALSLNQTKTKKKPTKQTPK